MPDCVAERGGFEPSRPFISHMLPRSHAHFLLRGRIFLIIFIGLWEPCQRHPCPGMAQAIGRFENRPSRPQPRGDRDRPCIAVSRWAMKIWPYVFSRPSVSSSFPKIAFCRPRKTPATSCCGALAVPSRLALDTATPQTRSLCEPIRTLIEMETVGRLRHAR